jgi:hypothetical protein
MPVYSVFVELPISKEEKRVASASVVASDAEEAERMALWFLDIPQSKARVRARMLFETIDMKFDKLQQIKIAVTGEPLRDQGFELSVRIQLRAMDREEAVRIAAMTLLSLTRDGSEPHKTRVLDLDLNIKEIEL